jgi:hypothetical protein
MLARFKSGNDALAVNTQIHPATIWRDSKP